MRDENIHVHEKVDGHTKKKKEKELDGCMSMKKKSGWTKKKKKQREIACP